MRGRRLLQPLPGAGDAAPKKVVLSFQLLPRFQLAGEGGPALRFGLGDNGALMGLFVFQIVEVGPGRGDARLGLGHDRIVVRRFDLHQQFAGFDVLEIMHGNLPDIAAHPRTQPGHLGMHRGIVGRLDCGRSHPGVPTG